MFAVEVKFPVGVEVATRAERAKPEHGLGSTERPAGSGLLHPVFDEVSARSFDDAGRNRQSRSERLVVSKVVGRATEVADARADGRSS